jgi:hypothetical protein
MNMIIDRSGFLLMASVLAVGGVGGWALSSSGVGSSLLNRNRHAADAPRTSADTPPKRIEKNEPSSVDVAISQPQPTCDDSIGVPEECPSVGPADEGVCTTLGKRCNEFKMAFKPKVAQQAVACLRQLQGAQRCDPTRINLCGHAALMAACPEPEPPKVGTYVKATATTPASFIVKPAADAAPSPVMAACQSISKVCPTQSLNECRQTLAGMNDSGRAGMIDCMSKHCQDRGLSGCEAVPIASLANSAQR